MVLETEGVRAAEVHYVQSDVLRVQMGMRDAYTALFGVD
jgi:hypothetical protein